jgi:hypothetical protein
MIDPQEEALSTTDQSVLCLLLLLCAALHFHWLRKHTVKIQDAEVILILSTDP